MAKRNQVDDLTRVMMSLSSISFSEETVQSALDRICVLAHETIRGTAGAAITVLRGDRRATAAFSKEQPVLAADTLQYEMDEGPCLSAFRDDQVYRIDSMREEERWPRWAAAAAAMGVASSVSVPVKVRDERLGAMKVYSLKRAHYDEHDERILSMFAEQAGVVLSNILEYEDAQSTINQLKIAIETRDTIGMAKGILMAREGIDEAAAFDMLRTASQNQNVKLRDVAAALVEQTTGRRSET